MKPVGYTSKAITALYSLDPCDKEAVLFGADCKGKDVLSAYSKALVPTTWTGKYWECVPACNLGIGTPAYVFNLKEGFCCSQKDFISHVYIFFPLPEVRLVNAPAQIPVTDENGVPLQRVFFDANNNGVFDEGEAEFFEFGTAPPAGTPAAENPLFVAAAQDPAFRQAVATQGGPAADADDAAFFAGLASANTPLRAAPFLVDTPEDAAPRVSFSKNLLNNILQNIYLCYSGEVKEALNSSFLDAHRQWRVSDEKLALWDRGIGNVAALRDPTSATIGTGAQAVIPGRNLFIVPPLYFQSFLESCPLPTYCKDVCVSLKLELIDDLTKLLIVEVPILAPVFATEADVAGEDPEFPGLEVGDVIGFTATGQFNTLTRPSPTDPNQAFDLSPFIDLTNLRTVPAPAVYEEYIVITESEYESLLDLIKECGIKYPYECVESFSVPNVTPGETTTIDLTRHSGYAHAVLVQVRNATAERQGRFSNYTNDVNYEPLNGNGTGGGAPAIRSITPIFGDDCCTPDKFPAELFAGATAITHSAVAPNENGAFALIPFGPELTGCQPRAAIKLENIPCFKILVQTRESAITPAVTGPVNPADPAAGPVVLRPAFANTTEYIVDVHILKWSVFDVCYDEKKECAVLTC